jgi:cyclopropane-fatty-acyl-phospholipid synthase
VSKTHSNPLGPRFRDADGSVEAQTRARPGAVDCFLFERLGAALGGARLRLQLWNGVILGSEDRESPLVRIRDSGALRRLVLYPELEFGELYSCGRVDVDGDLVMLLEEIYRHAARGWRSALQRLGRVFWSAPDMDRARQNIHHHYDIGNDFYQLWLDPDALQYTCAYYARPEMSLVQAQTAKMHHVCRKVWLQPGESVIEAGCGWGGLALFMARNYGVRVRAYNISHEQIVYARDWARREGLADRVEFIEDDYRNATGRCDAFVSVGMLEHVGPGNYRTLGKVIDRCLEPHGRGLIHSIGRDRDAPLNPWIRKRIFPGAYPPTLREMTEILEPNGLSTLDVENLRLHYAQTLRDWLGNFNSAETGVRRMFDEEFVRAWRLYLAGSVAGFTTGTLQLFQLVFARAGGNRIPRTREAVYSDEQTGPVWHG